MAAQESKISLGRRFALSVVVAVVVQPAVTIRAADFSPTPPGTKAQAVSTAVGSRLLVQPRAGLSDIELDRAIKPHGGSRGQHLKEINVHVIELPAQANDRAIAQVLRHHPFLKFVELDQAVAPDATPNDPYFINAWHLGKIQAPAAWDYATGTGITIAIVDTGVTATHPDLINKVVPGWNVVTNSGDIADVYGHGTKVAGVAAASTNNAVGISGIGWYSKIMPVRIDDGTGYATYSAMAAGILWAANHGAKVANISYSGPSASATVQSAAQYMRSKGGVVVCSAGNSGLDPGFTASSHVTVVAATSSNDVKTSWSNFGAYVDVSAPGVGIVTTNKAGTYSSASGTSFSSPITSGIYALMMSANPTLSPASLDKILFSTAVDLGSAGYDKYYGHGRVNASAAVSAARSTVTSAQASPTASITAPTSGVVSGMVPVNVSATNSRAITKVELYAGSALIATDITAPYAFIWDTTLASDGAKTLQAMVYDAAGNIGVTAVMVNVANYSTLP